MTEQDSTQSEGVDLAGASTAPTGVSATPTGLPKPPNRDTPAMRQHAQFKAAHPDCILLFRLGDFFELFDDDAVTAHKALGITLTQRTSGIPMAGIPWHSAEAYIKRLVDQGFRVAIADQVQDPKDAKGVVERAVTRVITPGTRVDDSLLDSGAGNRVACVAMNVGGDSSSAAAGDTAVCAVATIELSTGAFTVTTAPSAAAADTLTLSGAAEVLLPAERDERADRDAAALCRSAGASRTTRDGWYWREAEARETLCTNFSVATLAGLGLPESGPVVAACGALLRYLRETQGESLAHLSIPRVLTQGDRLILDAASLQSLEIERTIRGGTAEGSLLGSFSGQSQPRTPMGRRLLREWLCAPLADLAAIRRRHAAVGALAEDSQSQDLLRRVREALSGVQDLARIAGRVAMHRATPRDVVAAARSIESADALARLLAQSPASDAAPSLTSEANALAPLAAAIRAQCVEEPPPHLREGGLFRDHIDAALDEARTLQTDSASWLARFQKSVIDETGIESLKVGFNRVFGYYIEVSRTHADKMPPAYARRQSLRNAERFTNEELKTFEEKVLGAEAASLARERALFDALLRTMDEHRPAMTQLADSLATIDCLATFAAHALRHRWVKPTMSAEATLEIIEGRHPVVDTLLGERFVPNDTTLGGSAAPLALITGPNMAGKSTYIRQVALIVLLAHAGSFVPATRARIGLTDRIATRIGASDELHGGQSTFMVEMTETASILNTATQRTIVVMDEVGRGTSTLDGLSLAWAITERLAAIGCRTLFATHYHELTEVVERTSGIQNLHVAVREWNGKIIFLHQIRAGSTDQSYGIHVAQLAGIPAPTVERARRLLETLALHADDAGVRRALRGADDVDQPLAAAPRSRRGSHRTRAHDGPSLFDPPAPTHPVVDMIKAIDLDRLTPLEAFDMLRKLREAASGPG
ncbi:MAG: DNA mismatch repair protein MutS [Planctomycetota bacterium]|nr:DNA mismatch repair protein MutS [Planctomycetota bacterium]MDA1106332.1 DNA mismatch repair protein MutS [Planctomycetota bacterium]